MKELWAEDHHQTLDFQYMFATQLTFSGITLMAVMEAFIMFYLVDELTPLMWAQHNIQYMNKLLQREVFRRIEMESFHSNRDHDFLELDMMSTQLYHTYLFARGLDIRLNQNSVQSICAVFPENKPLPMLDLLKLSAQMRKISKEQLAGIMNCGYTLSVVPGFTLFYKDDLIRDLVIIIDGYAYYDIGTRMDNHIKSKR